MKNEVAYIDSGTIRYADGVALQHEWFDRLVEAKRTGGTAPQAMIFCSHPHVYTLGKSGDEANMLVTGEYLESIGAEFHRTDRGGDVTYHGPGQIVGYPILDLEAIGLSLRGYIEAIEESVMGAMAHYGLRTRRMEGATGVWMEGSPERKICAIGVRSSRYITMHGFALNVATDNRYFAHINPCGMRGRGATSMEAELGVAPGMEELKELLCHQIEKNMNIKIIIKKNEYAYRKEMGSPPTGRSDPDGGSGREAGNSPGAGKPADTKGG